MDYSLLRKNIQVYSTYYHWFQFGDINFTDLTLDCLPDGRVFRIDLYKVYDSRDDDSQLDSIATENQKLPRTFIHSHEEITSLFGAMTKTEDNNDFLGYHIIQTWECENKSVLLTLWYSYKGNLPGYVLTISISFIDKNLEKNNKLWKYQH